MRVILISLCLMIASLPVMAKADVTERVLAENEVHQVVNGIITALDTHYLFIENVPKMKAALALRLTRGDFDRQFKFGRLRQQLEVSLFHQSGDSRFSLLERQGVTVTSDGGTPSHTGAIESGLLESGIGYVSFHGNTDYPTVFADIDTAFAAVSRASVVILDIRDASQASLSASQYLLSYFFEPGAPLADLHFAQGRTEHIRALGSVASGRFAATVPVFVITSSHVAGPWEFVAGTLSGQGRATLVGEQTMGVAVLTDTLALSDHVSLRFSRAYFTHPGNANSWQDWGVVVDHNADAAASFEKTLALAKAYLASQR